MSDVVFTVARTLPEVYELKSAWESVGVSYVDAEHEYYVARLATDPERAQPYVILGRRRGKPAVLVVASVAVKRLEYKVGYRRIFGPRLRTLRIEHGGIGGVVDEEAARAVLAQLEHALRSDADLLVLPAARVDSALARVIDAVPLRWRKRSFLEPVAHRQMVLPKSWEEFLESRDRKSRYNIRRQERLLAEQFPTELEFGLLEAPEQFEQALFDLEVIAAKTYQRGLGAGFVDTPQRRATVEVALRNGWFRAWVLRISGEPVAFWQGNVLHGIYYSSSTGYDPAYERYGVGGVLQMRMIRDLCESPDVSAIDFGWGDAGYKERFGNVMWHEKDVVVFAPTARAISANLAGTMVGGVDRMARRALESAGLTARVKKLWRSRLRASGKASPPRPVSK